MKKILIVASKNFVEDISNFLYQMEYGIKIADSEAEILKKARDAEAILFEDDIYKDKDPRLNMVKAIQKSKKDFIIVSSNKTPEAILEARDFGVRDYIVKPYNYRELILRLSAIIAEKKRISCIGGGTGLFNLLIGLKTLPNVLLTSIVSTTDDGGSSGRLRASFGVLPPGDIRRSLVALSNAPEIMNEVMRYRFQKGEALTGHSFGNLFLTALSDIKGSTSEGVKGLSDILNIQGIVVPVTTTETTLCAQFEDNTVIEGESKMDLAEGRSPDLHIKKLWHKPEPQCDINAYSSIINSDAVIIGPGDLFTSIITNILVRNIREAISATKAEKIYICNLMTKPGETADYDVPHHVEEIIKYMDGDYLDYIIISNTKLSDDIVKEYSKKDQAPVKAGKIEEIRRLTKAQIIMADVGHQEELVRHDSIKIRDEIAKIIEKI